MKLNYNFNNYINLILSRNKSLDNIIITNTYSMERFNSIKSTNNFQIKMKFLKSFENKN